MNQMTSTAKSLAALGHEARLGVFRLLVMAGPEGLSISDLLTHLDLAPSTLAHHMRALVAAELVVQEKQGREVISRVDFDRVRETVGFLTSECCVGVRLVEVDAA